MCICIDAYQVCIIHYTQKHLAYCITFLILLFFDIQSHLDCFLHLHFHLHFYSFSSSIRIILPILILQLCFVSSSLTYVIFLCFRLSSCCHWCFCWTSFLDILVVLNIFHQKKVQIRKVIIQYLSLLVLLFLLKIKLPLFIY